LTRPCKRLAHPAPSAHRAALTPLVCPSLTHVCTHTHTHTHARTHTCSRNTPTSPGYACNASDPQTTCEVGDLSGKFGVLVPDAAGRAQGVWHDASFGILSGHRATGLSAVVHNGSPRIACANLVPPAAIARFNSAGISGTVALSKASGGRYAPPANCDLTQRERERHAHTHRHTHTHTQRHARTHTQTHAHTDAHTDAYISGFQACVCRTSA
jgi:hypothetical protein